MEYTIGEKFEINGRVFVVVEDKSNNWEDGCGQCAVRVQCQTCYLSTFGECRGMLRGDRKSVHFKLVDNGAQAAGEKGGE